MTNKKFKLTMREARELIWKEIMEETEENFTDEFRQKVILAIIRIREAI
jgi:hypothetical protein